MFSENLFDEHEKLKSWPVFKMVYNLNNTFYFQWSQLTDAIPKNWENIVQNNFKIIESLTVKYHHIIRKQGMTSRQQKSAKKGSERYLMFGPNHILVTLRWVDGRYLVTKMYSVIPK